MAHVQRNGETGRDISITYFIKSFFHLASSFIFLWEVQLKLLKSLMVVKKQFIQYESVYQVPPV